jgi:hydroxypyruvate isomerase
MPWPLAANLSMLFPEAGLLDRVRLAAHAGFNGVEVQFPYEVPASSLLQVLQQYALPLALINAPAGDLMSGGPGLAGVPGREGAFAEALEAALDYARIARPQRVNVLPGRLGPNVAPEAAMEVLASNCRLAASRFAEQGIAVTCEAINRHDMPGFLVATAEELANLLDRVDHPNLSAQLDIYHMARTHGATDGVIHAMRTLAGRIGHVQFADCPGRGAPGQGGLDFERTFQALDQAGYSGWIAAEYRPTSESDLAWLCRWRQARWIS